MAFTAWDYTGDDIVVLSVCRTFAGIIRYSVNVTEMTREMHGHMHPNKGLWGVMDQ